MDGIGLLQTMTLSSMVLEAMPSTSTFATALYVGTPSPQHVLGVVDSRLHRISASCAFKQPSKVLSRRKRPASWGRTQDTPCCSLPAAASPDAAREEDPWMGDSIAAVSGDIAEGENSAPFFSHSMISAAATAAAAAAATTTATAAAATTTAAGDGEVDSKGGNEEMFTFAPSPLPEGTTLRAMQETDIDSVVGLAFEEFYEGPTIVEGVSGLDIWQATWRRARLNGSFQDSDVEELTDW